MMKIVAICVKGLASSLIVELNLKSILNDLNISATVEHKSLKEFDVNDQTISYVICHRKLANKINHKNKIVLKNCFSKQEILTKVLEIFYK